MSRHFLVSGQTDNYYILLFLFSSFFAMRLLRLVSLLNSNLSCFSIVLLSTDKSFKQDLASEIEQIKKAMGARVDVTFDCAGFNKTMSTALGTTCTGGKVCLVGLGHSIMTVPLAPAAVRYF